MREQTGNLWDFGSAGTALVITTNGKTRKDGTAVMGRGIAQQAVTRRPVVGLTLGRLLRASGNHVHIIHVGAPDWLSFPVKRDWWEDADPGLIIGSAHELVALTDSRRYQTVWLPRPGCGNGRLLWEDVKPLIEPILDDRFVVVNR